MSWKGGSTRAVIQDLFGIHTHTVMLAATGMHVGKTTLSLGVFKGLEKRYGKGRVAYCKPLGQRFKNISLDDGRVVKVDPDVEVLRNYFKLNLSWEHMSPVVFPSGFTRKVIDGEIHTAELLHKIKDAFTSLATSSDFTLVEGSGHMGVGSIVNLNNAQVAGALGLDVVIIAPGGLGSSFDQLALNKSLLEKHGARLRGVIVNKVQPEKFDMVKDYYGRVLSSLWDTPLLGCIPYYEAISKPSMIGFAQLLNSNLVAGEESKHRTFESTRVVLSETDETIHDPVESQLIVTHASRSDVIESIIKNHKNMFISSKGSRDLRGGLVLVGADPPKSHQLRELDECKVPTLWVEKGHAGLGMTILVEGGADVM
ncbi:hypothetical protein GUITHDRAFT_64386 [Guillardia theta CCMP2712]|uniref:DRTGG domain-containing protein n=1 Tax=Guillardia theta (strain CCMP2712) TaxID=905079 RepID=L1JYP0_GUITC|nr:hypothetical protein GUITHDRAFT_64386 [Guillardia theta CCMP2712]EKX53454.1 hypothetical protein GUITHDRAFT_64386 [Guillardia theta CCMP2712]|eukprot:XP_005840434.1 hypothetical protein GUITHDRAFT_64386 [Guillardia theta CCMP2712]